MLVRMPTRSLTWGIDSVTKSPALIAHSEESLCSSPVGSKDNVLVRIPLVLRKRVSAISVCLLMTAPLPHVAVNRLKHLIHGAPPPVRVTPLRLSKSGLETVDT